MNASTVQDMWNTRPVRRRDGSMVAGVCSGIAERYRVDPTLVRVAFVVAAIFGGSSILVYVAALIAFPSMRRLAPESVDYAHRRGNGARLKWLPLVIGAIIAMSIIGSQNRWGSSGIIGMLALAAGWYLLYQRTPVPPAGTSVDTVTQPAQSVPVGAAAGAGAISEAPGNRATSNAVGDDANTERLPDQAPSWDPLGTARFAWDLPEPATSRQPPVPSVPPSPVTPITIGLATIVGAAASAASIAGVEWFTVGRIASLVLATLGLGLLTASMLKRPAGHRGSGLIPFAVLAGTVVLVATVLTGQGRVLPAGGIGERSWAPTSYEELKDEYSLTVGSSTLDLTGLTSLDRDRTILVRQAVGEIRILLPENIRVKTDCNVLIGDARCTSVVNPDAKTPTLTIDARNTLGQVEMIP